jgi:hypothetical protein
MKSEARRELYESDEDDQAKTGAYTEEAVHAAVGHTDVSHRREEILDNLLGDLEGATPSFEAKVVRHFFNQHKSLPQGSETSAWAWMDDREYSTGRSRAGPEALSSTKLREALNKEVSAALMVASANSKPASDLGIPSFQMLIDA